MRHHDGIHKMHKGGHLDPLFLQHVNHELMPLRPWEGQMPVAAFVLGRLFFPVDHYDI